MMLKNLLSPLNNNEGTIHQRQPLKQVLTRGVLLLVPTNLLTKVQLLEKMKYIMEVWCKSPQAFIILPSKVIDVKGMVPLLMIVPTEW